MRLTGDVVARHPTPADGPAIEAMYARCSFESRYARLLAPLAAIPGRHLAQVLVTGPTDEAWVAVRRDDPGTVLALGSWARDGTDAELALIVEDSWQRRGIGSSLVRILGERASNAGVCRLTASVLTESRHVFRMLRSVLGPLSTRVDGHVSLVTIDRCESS